MQWLKFDFFDGDQSTNISCCTIWILFAPFHETPLGNWDTIRNALRQSFLRLVIKPCCEFPDIPPRKRSGIYKFLWRTIQEVGGPNRRANGNEHPKHTYAMWESGNKCKIVKAGCRNNVLNNNRNAKFVDRESKHRKREYTQWHLTYKRKPRTSIIERWSLVADDKQLNNVNLNHNYEIEIRKEYSIKNRSPRLKVLNSLSNIRIDRAFKTYKIKSSEI